LQKLLTISIAGLLMLGGFVFPGPVAAAPVGSVQELASLINQYRASRGLVQLGISPTLTAAAQWMATDMATKNYFPCCHVSLDGRTPTQRMADFGYPAYSTVRGETIAVGYATAAQVLNVWRNSPPHNGEMLDPRYRALGIGLGYNPSSTFKWYWVANYGGILDSGAAPAPQAPPPARQIAQPVARAAPAAPAASAASVSRAVEDSGFHAAWVDQTPYPTVSFDDVIALTISFRNTGSRTWVRGVPEMEARLGTRDPLDRSYPELQWEWPAPNRPAIQEPERVAPGEVGRFTFRIRAPRESGTYTLAVRPVVDGIAWLEDAGAFWTITVRWTPELALD
jgi:hypothetical protein